MHEFWSSFIELLTKSSKSWGKTKKFFSVVAHYCDTDTKIIYFKTFNILNLLKQGTGPDSFKMS